MTVHCTEAAYTALLEQLEAQRAEVVRLAVENRELRSTLHRIESLSSRTLLDNITARKERAA